MEPPRAVPQGPGQLEHGGWRASVPPGARVVWPKLCHNPYKKDGSAGFEEAGIVLGLPFSGTTAKQEIALEIVGSQK